MKMNSDYYVKHRRVVEAEEDRPAFTRFSVYAKNHEGKEAKIGAGFIPGTAVSDNACIYHLLDTMRLKYVN